MTAPGRSDRPGRHATAEVAARARVWLPLLGLWAALALALSELTTRVVDWFVMSDELFYERLAISVFAEGEGSLLPHLHGQLITSVNHLYPLLIAPAFRNGLVDESLHDAHIVGAWVMSSACIPAFLLTRRVTGRLWVAYLVALLSVCLPWITLSSFLLTEVAAYPAFLWAVLALQRATAAPSRGGDLLLLGAVTIAVLARVQFLVLFVVAPLAIYAHALAYAPGGTWVARVAAAGREGVRSHPVLAVAYGFVVVATVLLLALGRVAGALGTYSDTATGDLVPNGIHRAFAEHAATLALGLGILPFLVGGGWLLASLVRPPSRELHAFASVGTFTILALLLQVTVFDLRFGGVGLIRDRYLFYAAPLVLVAFACALGGTRWPRWSVLVPTALVSIGFATAALPRYDKLNVDTPVAVMHDVVLDAAGSTNAARVMLVAATVVLATLFLQGTALLRRSHLAAVLVALTVATLPAETAYAFYRLFRVDGTAGRPLTLEQSVVFTWVDRGYGTWADVTMIPYPNLPGEYWPSVAYWWDLEFWNKSIVRSAHFRGQYEWTSGAFPRLYLRFDPTTGASSASPTPYVAQSEKDTRFRIAGIVRTLTSNVFIIEAERPWRAAWKTYGLYGDGWTKPGLDGKVRVFAFPGQEGSVKRALLLAVRAPFELERRPFHVVSNLDEWHADALGEAKVERIVEVCVPAGGYADVRISTPEHSLVYGDMRDQDSFAIPREAGVFLTQIALADEVGGPCEPRTPRR